MKVLLYQPDIAGNVGTIIRLCACLDLELDIIEPCGFPFDDKKFKRAGMDYIDCVKIHKFSSFHEFMAKNPGKRIVLLTTKADESFSEFLFDANDVLMVGRETAGVPDEIHNLVDKRIVIPMKNNMRCLNVAVSLAMVMGVAISNITK
ncbi:MAG: tRNA (cytidine(34)-2'-O)-methyltransferase [Rickettsiales bacterium]|jgi:tRNA (cytidine/uridine-2'-O-)-methyltransferase|nr:tRNA (cytidine(34)-2'-O)-methyltransferase [Rickettsiales bacterium]